MKSNNNKEISFEQIAVIEKKTGGIIDTYEWWEVKGNKNTFTSLVKPKDECDILFHGSLPNSFKSKSGIYIGDIERANFYVKNRLKVCEEYPHGVAEVHDDNGLIGYYGYSHRGGCLFKIGDRIFNEKYIPKKEDYTKEQWDKFDTDYNKAIKEAELDSDELALNWLKEDGITGHIPFNLIGDNIIKTWGEAIIAAKNVSDYLG